MLSKLVTLVDFIMIDDDAVPMLKKKICPFSNAFLPNPPHFEESPVSGCHDRSERSARHVLEATERSARSPIPDRCGCAMYA
jgi:hypothetical protein